MEDSTYSGYDEDGETLEGYVGADDASDAEIEATGESYKAPEASADGAARESAQGSAAQTDAKAL